MTEAPPMLKAVLADPGDDTTCLAYADWLDENGNPRLAEFIRLQVFERVTDPDLPSHLYPENQRLAWVAAYPTYGADNGERYKGAWGCDIRYFRSGLLAHYRGSATRFVAYADDYVWHPTQTAPCRRCLGEGVLYVINPDPTYRVACTVPCPDCHKGRTPRECPPRAQPVRSAILTGLPPMVRNPHTGGWRLAALSERFMSCNIRTENRIDIALRLLAAEWPWISFTILEPFG